MRMHTSVVTKGSKMLYIVFIIQFRWSVLSHFLHLIYKKLILLHKEGKKK